jgi:hypothetical protein
MRPMRNLYRTSDGLSERKGPHERLRHTCEDNIKMDLKVIVCEVFDWIQHTQSKNCWDPGYDKKPKNLLVS